MRWTPPQRGTGLAMKAPASSVVSIAARLARRRPLTRVSRGRRDRRSATECDVVRSACRSAVLRACSRSQSKGCRMSVVPFSSRFKQPLVNVGSAEQYVRTGGSGPAVLLLHGFGETGDMWQPLAEILVDDHTVIVPDLRGM